MQARLAVWHDPMSSARTTSLIGPRAVSVCVRPRPASHRTTANAANRQPSTFRIMISQPPERTARKCKTSSGSNRFDGT